MTFFFFVIYSLCKLTLYMANVVAVTLEDYFKSVFELGGRHILGSISMKQGPSSAQHTIKQLEIQSRDLESCF